MWHVVDISMDKALATIYSFQKSSDIVRRLELCITLAGQEAEGQG